MILVASLNASQLSPFSLSDICDACVEVEFEVHYYTI
jgi:hypothetical protein